MNSLENKGIQEGLKALSEAENELYILNNQVKTIPEIDREPFYESLKKMQAKINESQQWFNDVLDNNEQG